MANKKFECETCEVTTSDQTSHDNHMLGSKHQLALHAKIVKEKKEKCGIYVTGFYSTAKKEDVRKLFESYGKMVEFFSDDLMRYAIIQYEEESIAKLLLKTEVKYMGRVLTIRPRVLKVNNDRKQQKRDETVYEEVVELISKYDSFNDQLNVLKNEIQLPHSLIMNIYQKLCYDIQQCLAIRFSNCRVWPFGSTVSGLDFIGSDVDVYIEVVYHPVVANSTESLASAYAKIARNLLNKSNLFSNVIAIPKAKTPIVKCIHTPTGVSCDMNFKNMLGVCNSQLIRFLLQLDPRLRSLLILIKFWAKIQEISGSGRISNYGLSMLAIFYLQQQPNPILPPVGLLQMPEFCRFYEGWNGGFCNNIDYLPPISRKNSASIPELLLGFFRFYSKYEYGFNVICPLTGESQTKANFEDPKNLPLKFFHYKNMVAAVPPLKTYNPMCLQDPFELAHNITGCVSAKQLEDFQKLCDIAANICSESIATDESNLLKKLLKKSHIVQFVGATDDICAFKIAVGATLIYVDNNVEANIEDKPKVLRKLWFDTVNQFLISVLSKLFLFSVTIKKDMQQIKVQKVEGQNDIHDNNIIDSVSFHCVGYNNVWDARKSISKTLNQIQNNGTNFLDREIAISEYIVNVLCKEIKIADPVVDFNLVFNSRINPTEAEFLLENLNSRKNCFKHMANYVANRLPIWFERYLREANDSKSSENNEKECVEKKECIEEKNVDEKINIADMDNSEKNN